MKKLIPFILLLVLVVALKVLAVSGIMIGALATVNNTTSNSTAVAVGTAVLPGGYLLIQNAGLLTTNSLTVNVQFSADGLNWQTVGTYNPTSTNATTERYFIPSTALVTNYYRAQVVTTNSVQVGINFLQ